MFEQTVAKIDQAIRSDMGLWLLCAAFAIWIAIGWSRRWWQRFQSKRRRKAFDSREMRNWQGHRRESSKGSRLDGKKH